MSLEQMDDLFGVTELVNQKIGDDQTSIPDQDVKNRQRKETVETIEKV